MHCHDVAYLHSISSSRILAKFTERFRKRKIAKGSFTPYVVPIDSGGCFSVEGVDDDTTRT